MKIGFIGGGKLGTALGRYFIEHSLDVIGYASKTRQSSLLAADFTNTKVMDIKNIIKDSQIIFLTVTDGAIEVVWNEVSKYNINGKIICHCSGALSSSVFKGIDDHGAKGASLHPFIAISNKESYKELKNASFTVEGNEETLFIIKKLLEPLDNKIYSISKENKILYHTSAVIASNFVVVLAQLSIELMEICEYNDKESLIKLIESSVINLKGGVINALTGPIERGDKDTITKHIEALNKFEDSSFKNIYTQMSKKLVEIAKKKNPNTNYEDIEDLLNACTSSPHL